MEVEVKKKVENPLLKRHEVECDIDFGEEAGTPEKEKVREIIARALAVNTDLVVINKLLQQFGAKKVRVLACTYKSKEAMESVEKKKEKKAEGGAKKEEKSA